MVTFTLEHAVDFQTGTAKVGKCLEVDKRTDKIKTSFSERIKKMNKARANGSDK